MPPLLVSSRFVGVKVAGIVSLIMVAIAFVMRRAIACFIYGNIDRIFCVGNFVNYATCYIFLLGL
ncbi:MAG: hypothetical protein F6K25_05015 [Okeania sp. SIO2G4]|uniref:hypothetical protein n=1 Tax=unclassified Okeania TaxID=2634635 RepID=UPI0013BAD9CD|nr:MULTISPECIES: hypothetical protein [unclassified Okeania]NEP05275.1 hypothetical protein [Okeania sp. SIO4D6]NEP41610.1 hypothetical protein [Okeania sp. SIO2H7]NEP71372.1 hypothetical protein [Okeania sp. SIO2G5]NEP92584.1 hypothetical protein [Okeania sp. SIO2F5]NEQ90122.1 hypothetical protein [Okeania sp. SIO2G4]